MRENRFYEGINVGMSVEKNATWRPLRVSAPRADQYSGISPIRMRVTAAWPSKFAIKAENLAKNLYFSS